MNIDYKAVKDFEDWMRHEEERMKNLVIEMPVHIDIKIKPYFKQVPKIDRQLQLF